MNLYFLISKKDPNVAVTDKAVLSAPEIGGALWRGVSLLPDAEPQIVIRNASNFYPFRDRPETVGWRVASGAPGSTLSLWFARPGGTEPVFPPIHIQADEKLQAVPLPWSLGVEPHGEGLDLVIHAPAENPGPVFLGVHHALDRSRAVALCKGQGVEIGPGARPQILPGPDVEVFYIEQMPAEAWREHYGKHFGDNVDQSLWDRYRVGDAHDLPVEDASLDFIFSSHVFEHLPNPLRHLELWASKLRKGGRIVAVVPDLSGANDYRAEPSTLEEIIAEYERGGVEPSISHYERYVTTRANPATSTKAKKLFDQKRSIHIHYYTHANMAALMREASRRFGLQDFSIMHAPNHKDFHLVAIR